MTIIYEIAHVKLYITDRDLLELQIEDTELFDTFDDILHEKFDIENYSISKKEKDGIGLYTLCFAENIDKDTLYKAVTSIEENEVIEIYKINNP